MCGQGVGLSPALILMADCSVSSLSLSLLHLHPLPVSVTGFFSLFLLVFLFLSFLLSPINYFPVCLSCPLVACHNSSCRDSSGWVSLSLLHFCCVFLSIFICLFLSL